MPPLSFGAPRLCPTNHVLVVVPRLSSLGAEEPAAMRSTAFSVEARGCFSRSVVR